MANFSIAENLTFEDNVRMAEIEESYFDKSFIALPEVTWKWHKHNPRTVIAVRDDGTGLIIGHMMFLPIDDQLYLKIKGGNFIDTEISTEHILKYVKPGKYKLYFYVICVAPEYRKQGVSIMLVKEYAKKLLDLKKQGIYFTDIIADTITDSGGKFARKVLGMEVKKESMHASEIMWTDGESFYERLNLINR